MILEPPHSKPACPVFRADLKKKSAAQSQCFSPVKRTLNIKRSVII